MTQAPAHRILCIVYSDVVGSTSASVDARRAGQDLADSARQERLLAKWREGLQAEGALFIKALGDGVLATFADTRAALISVVDIVRGLVADAELRDIAMRIGLHVGTVVVQPDGDIQGSEASLGQRVMSCAEPGEILLSDDCAAQLRRYLPLDFELEDRGERRLKGFDTPVRVHRLHAPGLAVPAASHAAGSLAGLPVLLDVFVGREQERRELREWLNSPLSRCITLVGMPGAGKTRLALETAREAAPLFPGGVHFVALDEVVDQGGILTRIAAALDVPMRPNVELLQTLQARLAGKRFLIVLDNFEQALPAAGIVLQLMERLPELRLLITSREPLQIRGERVYDLDPLEVPPEAALLARIRASESVRMLTQRVQARDRRFKLTQQNADDVAAICRTLCGLPLAIEIVAAEARYRPLARLRAEIGDEMLNLQTRLVDAPPRQRSLRAAFDWSYAQLSEPDRLLFEQLGLFETAFSESDLHDVGTGADLIESLRRLCDKSLIRYDSNEREHPYRLLIPAREYARERLGAPTGAVRHRFIAAFTRRAQRLRDAYYSGAEPEALRGIQADLENFRAAWRLACEDGDSEPIADLGMAVTFFAPLLPLVANIADWIETTEFALMRLGDTERLGALCNTQARLANLRGDYPETVRRQREAIRYFETIGAEDKVADMHSTLALLALRAKDLTTAMQYARSGAELSRRAETPESEATALYVLASGMIPTDPEQADRLASRSLELYSRLRQARGMAHATSALAAVAESRGRFAEAERYHQEALRLYAEQEAEVSLARCQEEIGAFYARRGNLAQAAYHLEAAANTQRSLGISVTAELTRIELIRPPSETDHPTA